jgi:hypothetical protein
MLSLYPAAVMLSCPPDAPDKRKKPRVAGRKRAQVRAGWRVRAAQSIALNGKSGFQNLSVRMVCTIAGPTMISSIAGKIINTSGKRILMVVF